MDLIAHWLKDEPILRTELQEAMLAMGQQLNETQQAFEWPLRQWQSWLDENSFNVALLQQALLQLFTNADEAEAYASICQELSEAPADEPGIERLLSCAEQHSEKLVPQMLDQLEAEAKQSEALLNTAGGTSHKLAHNVSNHPTAWEAGGAASVLLLGGVVWAYRVRSARRELRDAIGSVRSDYTLPLFPRHDVCKTAELSLRSIMPGKINAARKSFEAKFPELKDAPAEYFYKHDKPLSDGIIAVRGRADYDTEAYLSLATDKVFNLRGTGRFKDDSQYIKTLEESFYYLRQDVCKDDPFLRKELVAKFSNHLDAMIQEANGALEKNSTNDSQGTLEELTRLNNHILTEEKFNSGERDFSSTEVGYLSNETRGKLFSEGKFPADFIWEEGGVTLSADEVFQKLTYYHQEGNLRIEGKWTEMDDIHASRVADIDPCKYLEAFRMWDSEAYKNGRNGRGPNLLRDRAHTAKYRFDGLYKNLSLTGLTDKERGRAIFGDSLEDVMLKRPSPDASLKAYSDIDNLPAYIRRVFEQSETFKDLVFATNIQHDARMDAGAIQHTYWPNLRAGWKVINNNGRPDFIEKIPYKDIVNALEGLPADHPERIAFIMRQGPAPKKITDMIHRCENTDGTAEGFCKNELNKILTGSDPEELEVFTKALNSTLDSFARLHPGVNIPSDQKALNNMLKKAGSNIDGSSLAKQIDYIGFRIRHIVDEVTTNELLAPTTEFYKLYAQRNNGDPVDEEAFRSECDKLKNYKYPSVRDVRQNMRNENEYIIETLKGNIQKEREGQAGKPNPEQGQLGNWTNESVDTENISGVRDELRGVNPRRARRVASEDVSRVNDRMVGERDSFGGVENELSGENYETSVRAFLELPSQSSFRESSGIQDFAENEIDDSVNDAEDAAGNLVEDEFNAAGNVMDGAESDL